LIARVDIFILTPNFNYKTKRAFLAGSFLFYKGRNMNIEKCMKKQCDFCKIKDKCFKNDKEREESAIETV